MSKDKNPGYFPGFPETGFEKKGKKIYPHQVGTTEKCNFCAERIDAGTEKGLKPGIDRDATPACVNTCQARALTFGDLDDPDSEVSRLIRERDGFQLRTEYGTDPSVYYIDYKLGGALSNKAPNATKRVATCRQLSSVDADARKKLAAHEEELDGESLSMNIRTSRQWMVPHEWMVKPMRQTEWIDGRGLLVWLAEVFSALGTGLVPGLAVRRQLVGRPRRAGS